MELQTARVAFVASALVFMLGYTYQVWESDIDQ